MGESASDQLGDDDAIGEPGVAGGVVGDDELTEFDVGAGDDNGLLVVAICTVGGSVVWRVRGSVVSGRAEVVVGDSTMCTVWAGAAACGRTSRYTARVTAKITPRTTVETRTGNCRVMSRPRSVLRNPEPGPAR